MITNNEVKVLDINAAFNGLPQSTLMENAGKQAASFIKEHFQPQQAIIICGKGNNGGDGFVTARYLADSFRPVIYLVGKKEEIKTDIAQLNFEKLTQKKIKVYEHDNIEVFDSLLEQSTLIVDAMLGVGLTGSIREPFATIIERINKTNKKIISLDTPTGLGTKPTIKPSHTLTFHDEKPNMTKETCGSIHIIDIGISKEIQQSIGPGDLSIYYPRSKKRSHKGENGKVLVVGGGIYTGAPALSALAALRSGADLAYVATPKQTASIVASYSPNLIVYPLISSDELTKDDTTDIIKLYEKVNTVIIGPGLGASYETADAIRVLVQEAKKQQISMVIDADAIHAVSKNRDSFKNTCSVITPHAHEFKSLVGDIVPDSISDRKQLVEKWAQKLEVTLFLKGPTDIISNGFETKTNRVHTEAMTVGGTGDVLAGIIGSFLSKGVAPFIAARMAAFLNGQAGRNVYAEKSYGLLATDIIREIPYVLKTYV